MINEPDELDIWADRFVARCVWVFAIGVVGAGAACGWWSLLP